MTNLEIEHLENSVRESASNILSILLEESKDCISIKDLNGRYLMINSAGAAFLGLTPQDIIGKTDFELFSKEAAQKIRETDELVMKTGQSLLFDAPLTPLNAKLRHFQSKKNPYKNSKGQIQGVIIVTSDITDYTLSSLPSEVSHAEVSSLNFSHHGQNPLQN